MKTILLSTCAALSVLCAGAAVAADLPIKAPPPVVPVQAPWTGCGIGFNVGGGWGDTWWSNPTPALAGSYSLSGAVAGGQLYCDYQTGPFVIGLEASYDWTNLDGNYANGAGYLRQTTVNALGGAGGRVGLVVDKSLIFVRAQAVWADVDHTQTLTGFAAQTISETRFGWGIGAGLEYMIAPVLTARIEYNYNDFGTQNYSYAAQPAVTYGEELRLHVLKLGVNYKFW
ncbi:hypothetical protein CCR97_26410 [Rhodoplanes elegans]|uniref:Outer membrane protein beta-barrel domain-containing protein n=1 Tax=Rhodoplanes elegans TaxID=29408 RepID=A0A327JTY4_9BRAD|nr:outer membrane protein [Rhodoplanes elegans]MBK5961712.1 hypothetical protein [Rhodoplanes elegans]RAI29939.1 hypothetical protein CH338_28145 [Rhodoplanes elegans]